MAGQSVKLGVSFYYVGDIREATEAYARFFERDPVYSDLDWVRFMLDGGYLGLHHDPRREKTQSNPPIQYGAVVSFTVPDIDAALARGKAQGFRRVGDVQQLSYGRQAEVRDPWGNRLSLLEPDSHE